MSYKEHITKRLTEILNEIFSGNKSAFANAIGQDESRIRSYTHEDPNKRALPSAEFIACVIQNIEINPEWLLLGIGEMKKDPEINTTNTTQELLLSRVEELAIENDRLKLQIEILSEQKKGAEISVVTEPAEELKRKKKTKNMKGHER